MALTSSLSSAFLLLLLLLLATVTKEIASQLSGGNSAAGGPEWNYNMTSEHGPDNWDDSYPMCGGRSQSPINIASIQANIDSLLTDFSYTDYSSNLPSEFEIKNTGSSIQLSGAWKSAISGGGLTDGYKLSQLHFHWGQDGQAGSEHLIDGIASPLEIHLVHWNDKYETFDDSLNDTDGVAVLGVFVQVSSSSVSSALGNMTAYFDKIPHPENVTKVPSFDLNTLLPERKTYYRYKGSLTTPACQESVTWTVFHDPIYMNENEMAKFRTIYDSAGEKLLYNFRPTQQLNGRLIYTSVSASPIPHQPTTSATVLATLSVVMAIVTHDWSS